MIWFTCKQCGKAHGRPESSVGSLVFCECGQGNMVPWESTIAEPPTPEAPPARAVPAAPVLEPVSFDRDRRSRAPGTKPRRRPRYTPDPNFCLNHEAVPSQKTCPDCGESFCDDCLVPFQGTPVCGPCKNYRVRALQQSPQLSTQALISLLLAFVIGPLAIWLVATFSGWFMSVLVLTLHALPLVLAILALRKLEKNPKLSGRSLAFTTIMMAGLTVTLSAVLTIFGAGIWS